MKQHCLTSERTTTPADNKPNALDITAIREPVWIWTPFTALNVRFGGILPRRGGAFRQTVKQPLWMSLHQHQAGKSA